MVCVAGSDASLTSSPTPGFAALPRGLQKNKDSKLRCQVPQYSYHNATSLMNEPTAEFTTGSYRTKETEHPNNLRWWKSTYRDMVLAPKEV